MENNKPRFLPSRGFWAALLVGFAAVAVWFFTRPCNPFKQSANMEKAAAHAGHIKPTLLQDARFGAITVSQYTGGTCGCMLVRGVVATDADLAALKEAIAASRPPTEVAYHVDVDEEQWKLYQPEPSTGG
jgi:hypothetical protein